MGPICILMPFILGTLRRRFGCLMSEQVLRHSKRHVHPGRNTRRGEELAILDATRLSHPIRVRAEVDRFEKMLLVGGHLATIQLARHLEQEASGTNRQDDFGLLGCGAKTVRRSSVLVDHDRVVATRDHQQMQSLW